MTRRGKVLRDTTSGPGLLIIEGQQYHFSGEGLWKSEGPPKRGMIVDAELDVRGKVHAISVVPDSQLAREAAGRRERIDTPSRVTSIGLPRLTAAALLAAAWFIPAFVSIQVSFPQRLELTFWQTLGLLNAGNVAGLLQGRVEAEPGLYAFAFAIALTGPFLPLIWNDKRAHIGGIAPPALMIIVVIVALSHLQNALRASGEMHVETPNWVSFGPGAYISILISLYLVYISAKGWTESRRGESQPLTSRQRKAA